MVVYKYKKKGELIMITYEDIIQAQETVVECWGEDGKKIIEAAHSIIPFNDGFKKFLTYCTPCGGNWGGMLLSGIKELFPTVWDAIPNDMGVIACAGICNTLILCGVDTSEGN